MEQRCRDGPNVWYYPQNIRMKVKVGMRRTHQRHHQHGGDQTDRVRCRYPHDFRGRRYRAEIGVHALQPCLRVSGQHDLLLRRRLVEYTTNGNTWQDARPLFTDNGYRGTISTRRQPAGRSGVRRPEWDTSQPPDLNSLAAQNIRFRFRIASDASKGALGWWIDDIRIYTCDPLEPKPDVSIVKRAAGSNFSPGDPISFILTITNQEMPPHRRS